MQAVIMAGGKGTRLSSVTKGLIPKPMVPFCGKPLIEHILLNLKENGIDDFVICIGHLGNQISDYLGGGEKYGVNIQYVTEDTPLGTAGALYYAKQFLHDDFVIVYADLMLDIDLKRMYRFHSENKADATLFVHPNSHPFDSDLVVSDTAGRVSEFDFKDHERNYDYDNSVNAGLVVFSPSVLDYFKEPKKIALEKGIISRLLIDKRRVFAYHSPEYIKDVGTPDRLAIAEREYLSGKIHRRNLNQKQKAIFIDRDGTLNIFKGLIKTPDAIELISGVAEAVRTINESEYLLLVVTNQPVVARGDCSEDEVDAINKRLFTLLGKQGAFVDDLLYCPHHTDKGFPGERPELKFDCDCRKPRIGMISKFAEKYNVDLSLSWMIGDTFRDIKTGSNAGIKTILIPSKANPEQERFDAVPDFIVSNLSEAADIIMK